MQYSWGIAIVVLFIIGTLGSTIAIGLKGAVDRLGAIIQSATTVAIFLALGHNIFWEREINAMETALTGWTLLYTLPPFLICFFISLILAIVHSVRPRKLRTPEGAVDTAASRNTTSRRRG